MFGGNVGLEHGVCSAGVYISIDIAAKGFGVLPFNLTNSDMFPALCVPGLPSQTWVTRNTCMVADDVVGVPHILFCVK